MIVVMIFMIMVVVIMIVVMIIIAIAVIVVIMMMAMPVVVVVVVVMFVRVPVSPAGWIIPVIVTVALVVTVVCRGNSRVERHTAETNHGRSSEGDYRLTGHAGFLQMCTEERTFS
jgi:membrane protein implicated in regulation of membrane protease activity